MAERDDSRGSGDGVAPGVITRLLAEVAATGPPDEGPAPRPGEAIGRFELVREIGSGGFGHVFEARDRELNRRVALKVLRPRRRALTAQEGDMLRQEGEAAAQLSHENVVTVHEIGRCDFGLYLVMELLEGQTLAERLERGPLPPDEAVGVGVAVARALVHAHARGVLHRDLKPSNVFLCAGGGTKVLDFGLARVLGGGSPSGGTPQFMAPEQWREEEQDGRTDLFALGVTLHLVLSGALPYAAPVRSTGAEAPPPPELPRRAAPRALRRLVLRCLAPAPRDRPGGAPEVLAALERHLPERRRARRRRAALLLALALAGAALWPERGGGPVVPVAVADFDDATGDPGLAGLSTLLAAALGQSERLEVVPRTRLLDILEQAGADGVRPSRLDEARAREAARPAGARVLLAARLARDGEGHALAVRATEVEGGRELFAWTERGAGGLPALIERVASRVRRGLGESGAEVERRFIPLGRAVTTSLAAWKPYYQGLECLERILNAGTTGECLEPFERAVALDPGFALAHLQRSYALHWQGRPRAEQRQALAPALQVVDRLAPRDQLRVRGWAAFLDGRDAEAKALLLRAAEASPDDKVLWYLAGEIPFHRDELAESVPLLLRAHRLDPTWVVVNQHLAYALGPLGRLDELREVAGRVAALGPRPAALVSLCYARLWLAPREAAPTCCEAVAAGAGSQGQEFLALALLHAGDRGALDALLAEVAAARPAPAEDWAWYMALYLRAQEGRWRKVRETIGAATVPDEMARAVFAEVLLGSGDAPAAWAQARRAQAADPHGASYLAVHFAHAGDLEHAEELSRHLPEGSPRAEAYRAVVRWRRGDPAGAVEALRAVDAQGPLSADPAIPFPAFLLGEALADAGRDGEAAAVLQRFLEAPLAYPAPSLPRALLVLARVQERAGDRAAARGTLGRLLSLWRDAEPGQPGLAEAHVLATRLGPRPRGGSTP
jgi:tetratricopeptide (TPR) repeat protein